MIYLTIAVICILTSVVLAVLSITSYNTKFKMSLPTKPSLPHFGLFVIQSIASLNQGIVEGLLDGLHAQGSITFELLIRDKDHALVLFAPRHIVEAFPLLHPVEIEDYLPALTPSQTLCLNLQFIQSQEPSISESFAKTLLTEVKPISDELLCFQVILSKTQDSKLRTNINVLIYSAEKMRSLSLREQLLLTVGKTTSLTQNLGLDDSVQIFENIKLRSFSDKFYPGKPITFDDLSRFFI